MKSIAKDTLLGLRYVDGELKQVYIDENGKEVIKDIEGIKVRNDIDSTTEFEQRFEKTSTIPQDMGEKTSPLVRKNLSKEYVSAVHNETSMVKFIQKHINMSLELHAMLIEVFGSPESFEGDIVATVKESLNKNSALKAYLLKHLKVMGEVWEPVYNKVR